MHHDGMHFFPLPYGSRASDRGLLAMNHEYTDHGLLFRDGSAGWSADKVLKSQAAHGVSVIEIRRMWAGFSGRDDIGSALQDLEVGFSGADRFTGNWYSDWEGDATITDNVPDNLRVANQRDEDGFYVRQPLPHVLQRALERYTNLFGIIIWRVFSVDLVNFYVRIQAQPRAGGTRRLVGQLGTWPRFNHVGEMICLTSVFTTLKYYPSNADIFRERLLRYARTLPHGAGDVLIFEYLSVVKEHGRFDWVPTAEYRVDLADASIDERILAPGFSPRRAHPASPVHEGATPGSYAPARPS